MKEVFLNVIERGGYDLTNLLRKIDTYYIVGMLSEAEKDELYAKARGSQIAQYDVKVEIEKLWDAIKDINSKLAENTTTEEPTTEYAEYVQPTGAHDAYMEGNIVTYNGKVYKCLMNYCVYAPDVYPAAWEMVEDTK